MSSSAEPHSAGDAVLGGKKVNFSSPELERDAEASHARAAAAVARICGGRGMKSGGESNTYLVERAAKVKPSSTLHSPKAAA